MLTVMVWSLINNMSILIMYIMRAHSPEKKDCMQTSLLYTKHLIQTAVPT